MYKANPMWEKITEDNFKASDINNFRSNGPNNRLATAYNPKTHGVLFFKTILYNMAQKLTKDDVNILQKIKNRNYGNPLSIKYNKDLEVDIDYLQSLNEIKFLDDTLKKITSICEIGAGYGRSVHSILFLYPAIEKYFVFDLKPVLELAKGFLVRVLPEELYEKIIFLAVEEDDDVFDKISADLCININSFQEMDFKVIQNYLHWIDKHCKYFYSNNTIGKFSPQLCGFPENLSTENALSAGLLTQKIDIFNAQELESARAVFIEKFKPYDTWKCLKHAPCTPWPHYYQALYCKTNA